MAKIVLIQYWMLDHMGVMTLAACLKREGHQATILVKPEEKNFLKQIADLDPDLVGFTCTTGLHSLAIQDARDIKKILPRTLTLMGGPHPTFNPNVINEDGLDIICRGEGEGALAELCQRIDQGKEYSDIPNLSVKTNGIIRQNELRPLIEDLDALPFPDRSHYERYSVLKKLPNRIITTGRGCIYNCTFCSNGALMTMYKGKGKFVRRRSVHHVINEIKQMRKEIYIKSISIEDDDFLDNHDWIKEFAAVYKKEVDMPFACLGRFDNVTGDIVNSLKKAGCYLLELGIESGNDKMRQKILRKCLPTQQIIDGARMLREYKLRFRTYNILGLPGETVSDAIDTLNLNIKIRPDFPTSYIWQPYPETTLVKDTFSSQSEDSETADLAASYYTKSSVNQENIKELENLQKLFPILVRKPLPENVVKMLIKLDVMRPIYYLIYQFSYLLDVAKVYNIGVFRALDIGLRLRRLH